jgi:hypothetical protein
VETERKHLMQTGAKGLRAKLDGTGPVSSGMSKRSQHNPSLKRDHRANRHLAPMLRTGLMR